MDSISELVNMHSNDGNRAGLERAPRDEEGAAATATRPRELLQHERIRFLSTENPPKKLHRRAGTNAPVKAGNTLIASQPIHRIANMGKRAARSASSRSTASHMS
jgi:hypothetical protein